MTDSTTAACNSRRTTCRVVGEKEFFSTTSAQLGIFNIRRRIKCNYERPQCVRRYFESESMDKNGKAPLYLSRRFSFFSSIIRRRFLSRCWCLPLRHLCFSAASTSVIEDGRVNYFTIRRTQFHRNVCTRDDESDSSDRTKSGCDWKNNKCYESRKTLTRLTGFRSAISESKKGTKLFYINLVSPCLSHVIANTIVNNCCTYQALAEKPSFNHVKKSYRETRTLTHTSFGIGWVGWERDYDSEWKTRHTQQPSRRIDERVCVSRYGKLLIKLHCDRATFLFPLAIISFFNLSTWLHFVELTAKSQERLKRRSWVDFRQCAEVNLERVAISIEWSSQFDCLHRNWCFRKSQQNRQKVIGVELSSNNRADFQCV